MHFYDLILTEISISERPSEPGAEQEEFGLCVDKGLHSQYHFQGRAVSRETRRYGYLCLHSCFLIHTGCVLAMLCVRAALSTSHLCMCHLCCHLILDKDDLTS